MPLQFVSCFQSPYRIQDGSAKGGTIQLIGPFGGPSRVVKVPEEARVPDIYAVNLGGLTAKIGAKFGFWVPSEDLWGPKKGSLGPKRALWDQNKLF